MPELPAIAPVTQTHFRWFTRSRLSAYTVHIEYTQNLFEMTHSPFQLSLADERPMYIQIMDNIKRYVITGQWQEGHALPSIREMAVTLKVSVITVKRAYQELEHEGIITTRRGMGSVIAEHINLASEQKNDELNNHLSEAIQLAQLLNISPNMLKKRLSHLIEEKMQ
jgi:GntR family transcriptional regulator